jgi:hypothetical protein
MPYVLIAVGPSTPENRYLARLGFDERGASQVAIHSYQMNGLPGIGAGFIRFENQPTTPIISDIFSSEFPLFNATGPDFFHQYNPPLLITEGDNQWNGSHQLIISLFDVNNKPLEFSKLIVLLQFVPVDPHEPEHRANEVKRTMATEINSRNVYPLPRKDELPFINSFLKTSYPYRP